ncbi:MAG: hypothetical protein AVDCRST_MAG54-4161, partial [uncultured Actinomycetospora sp.]
DRRGRLPSEEDDRVGTLRDPGQWSPLRAGPGGVPGDGRRGRAGGDGHLRARAGRGRGARPAQPHPVARPAGRVPAPDPGRGRRRRRAAL